MGFPGGSDGKESVCSAGEPGSIPGSERFPKEGNEKPLQCLENSMGRGAWKATYSPRGHRELDSTEQLTFPHFHIINLSCLSLSNTFPQSS